MDLSSGEVLHASDDIDQIWGYPTGVFEQQGPRFFLHVSPREHREAYFKIFATGWEYVNSLPADKLLYSTVNFDTVHRTKNSQFTRVLTRQVIVKLEDDGKIKLTLAIFTDISHIKEPKTKDVHRLSYYIPKTGEFLIYNPSTESMINLDTLTKREREILRFSVLKKTAGKIADELYISPYTVQTHRANLLEKTGCKNLAELVHFSKYHFLTYY